MVPRGRPPRAGSTRSQRVEFRLTAEEYDALAKFAGHAPIADTVRLVLLDAIAEAAELLPVVNPPLPDTGSTAPRMLRR